jgi:CubicO group peptidase (beta-lactamase class C family)
MQTHPAAVAHHLAPPALRYLQLVGEAYATNLNVSQATPLMGWSMTKSLLSVLVAIREKDGQLRWDRKVDLHEDGDDDRDRVTAQHLMDMTDGLDYREVSAAAKIAGGAMEMNGNRPTCWCTCTVP